MIYYIYVITNKINNKTYIGQRKCPVNKFPEQDIRYVGSGKIILQAFEKYGIKKNFKRNFSCSSYKRKYKYFRKSFY